MNIIYIKFTYKIFFISNSLKYIRHPSHIITLNNCVKFYLHTVCIDYCLLFC